MFVVLFVFVYVCPYVFVFVRVCVCVFVSVRVCVSLCLGSTRVLYVVSRQAADQAR